jgi:hypothetical protein
MVSTPLAGQTYRHRWTPGEKALVYVRTANERYVSIRWLANQRVMNVHPEKFAAHFEPVEYADA